MRTTKDLTDNPQVVKNDREKEAPIQTAYRYLTVTEGHLLELMTRTNPTMARAAQLGLIFNTTILHDTPNGPAFGNTYVSDVIGQIQRAAVGMDGRGRTELIDALNAGGRLPDSYYQKNGAASFTVEGDDD